MVSAFRTIFLLGRWTPLAPLPPPPFLAVMFKIIIQNISPRGTNGIWVYPTANIIRKSYLPDRKDSLSRHPILRLCLGWILIIGHLGQIIYQGPSQLHQLRSFLFDAKFIQGGMDSSKIKIFVVLLLVDFHVDLYNNFIHVPGQTQSQRLPQLEKIHQKGEEEPFQKWLRERPRQDENLRAQKGSAAKCRVTFHQENQT